MSDGIEARLARAESRLAALTVAVSRQGEGKSAGPTDTDTEKKETGPQHKAPSRWCLKELPRTKAAEAQWDEFTEWVDWLTGHYPQGFRDMPPCWYLHTDAVEELAALWQAWRYAYYGDDDPRESAMVWHERWLPGVCRRLVGKGGVLAPCTAARKHHPPNLTGAVRNNFDATLDEQPEAGSAA